MIIQAFPCRPYATNAYVVACPVTKQAIIIDPAPGSTPILLDYIQKNKLSLEKILLTHSHWDHIADAAALINATQVPLYVHPLDKGNLENPGSDGLMPMTSVSRVLGALSLKEGELISVGDLSFRVIHTPGHSPGGVCFYSEAENVLFSGDTLFKGSIGNLSLPTAQPALMWESLQKLGALPGKTKVYPGHGASTSIENEDWLNRAKEIF